MKKLLSTLLLALLVITLTGPSPAQASGSTLYVKEGGSGNCSDWANACSLQTALAQATIGNQIWVAAGTHSPGLAREDTFTLKSGVAVYGGFPNIGTPVWEDRNWVTNETILSGNNNSYHVVTTSDTSNATILDGFTITSGKADGPELAGIPDSEDKFKNKKGGGIYNLGGNPILRNLIIKNNYAQYDGGGLYNLGGKPELTKVEFIQNIADPASGNSAFGGGMYNESSHSTEPALDVILTDVVFRSNLAHKGGGLSSIKNSKPVITNATFEDNQARNGGALFNNDNSSPTITGALFKNNRSNLSGGAIFNDDGSKPIINKSYFIENKAAVEAGAYFGGAIFYRDIRGTSTITNSLFYKNEVEDAGGAIFVSTSINTVVEIINSTFHGNRVTKDGGLLGGAIASQNSTIILKNSILWGNLAYDETSGEYVPDQLTTSGGSGTITYSIIQGGGTGTGNLNSDPRFVNPEAGNLKLQEDSPAIDKATNTGCPIDDIENTSRPKNVLCDMGAYEVEVAFNGDTVGVFRPTNGALYLKNSNTTGFADWYLTYGLPGDYPIVGDWNGDGIDTIGIYRNGVFYLRNSNTNGFADIVFAFGAPGDQPVAGDWNGDGIDTVGVYRNNIGVFFLRNNNTSGPADMVFTLGIPGDIGIAGDWNGNGIDTSGVFRPSNGALYLKNSNTTGFADLVLTYGLPGDAPVTGDWNRNGIDTIGIYRNGFFYLRNSNTNGFADIILELGTIGDMPIAGDWNGLP